MSCLEADWNTGKGLFSGIVQTRQIHRNTVKQTAASKTQLAIYTWPAIADKNDGGGRPCSCIQYLLQGSFSPGTDWVLHMLQPPHEIGGMPLLLRPPDSCLGDISWAQTKIAASSMLRWREKNICSTSCFWVFLHAVREHTRTSRWLSVNIAAQVSTPVSDRPFLFLQLQNWVQSQGYWNDASDFFEACTGAGAVGIEANQLAPAPISQGYFTLFAQQTMRPLRTQTITDYKSQQSITQLTRARDRAYKQFVTMSCVRSSWTPSHHNQMLKHWFLPLKEARASWSSESLGNQN